MVINPAKLGESTESNKSNESLKIPDWLAVAVAKSKFSILLGFDSVQFIFFQ